MKKNVKKMFDFEDEFLKKEITNFLAGMDMMYWQIADDLDADEEMLDPESRLYHISVMTNLTMHYFSRFKQCDENQESIFNFIMFMMEQIYGKIDDAIMDEFLNEINNPMVVTEEEITTK
jgi:hypothetical protein